MENETARDPHTHPDVLRALAERHLAGGSSSTLATIADNPATPADVLLEIADQSGDNRTRANALRNRSFPAEVALEMFDAANTDDWTRSILLQHPALSTADTLQRYVDMNPSVRRLRSAAAQPALAASTAEQIINLAVTEAEVSVERDARTKGAEVLAALARNGHVTGKPLSRLLEVALAGYPALGTALLDREDLSGEQVSIVLERGGLGRLAPATIERLLAREDLSPSAVSTAAQWNPRMWSHPAMPVATLAELADTSSARASKGSAALVEAMSNPSMPANRLEDVAMRVRYGHTTPEAVVRSVAANPATPPDSLASMFNALRSPTYRQVLAANPALPPDLATRASRSKDPSTRAAAAGHPGLTSLQVRELTNDPHSAVRMRARDAARAKVVALGVASDNVDAIDALLSGEWWNLTPESSELALTRVMFPNP